MSRVEDITGQVFSRLTAIRRDLIAGRQTKWICRCQCGNERSVRTADLKRGNPKSCGCLKTERIVARSTKHGFAKRSDRHALYKRWEGMNERCSNPNHVHWDDYGGRGIAVCERWANFANFIEDMGVPPTPNHTLERVDNDKGYERANVVWALPIVQNRNHRNLTRISFAGRSLLLSEWAELLGISKQALYQRKHRGWSIERMLSR